MTLKTLEIDEKWSVRYDPQNNDRPTRMLRYEKLVSFHWDNPTTAMFYALLSAKAED